MKRPRLVIKALVTLIAVLALFGGLQANHKSLAVLSPDPDGGYTVFDSNSPPDNSGKFGTNTNCTAVIGTNNPCMPTGQSIQPFYVVGNNAQDYSYAFMTVAVYVQMLPNATASIQVINASPQCHNAAINAGLEGPDYDLGSPPAMQYVLYNNTGLVSSQAVFGGTCATVVTFSVPTNSAIPMTNPTNDLDGYFNLVADVLPSSGEGENSFTITNNVGGAGYVGGTGVAGLGYRFQNLNNGNYWDSFTTFAPPVTCNNYNNGSTFNGSVSFQDTDIAHTDWNDKMVIELQAQQINPDGSVGAWTLVPGTRKVQGTNMPQAGPLYSGAFQRDHRYRVLLANMGVRNTIRIDFSNGLDGVYADINERPTASNCVVTQDNATCNATITSPVGNIPPNSPVSIKIVATNTGSTTWNSTYYMKRVGPNVVNLQNVSGTVVKPNTATFTDTVQSPALGGKKTVTYRMYNGKGPFGSSCAVVIQPSPPAGTPSVGVNCNNVTVYNLDDSTVPATWHPGGGAATPINRVPIVIIVTDVSNGNQTSFLVNGGLPKGAVNTVSTPTFGMGGGAVGIMWPHKTYTFQLAVEGAAGFPPSDSATYQNNGFWNPTNNVNDAGFYYGIGKFNTVTLDGVADGCFDASCVGGQPVVDAEPGQDKTFTYGMNIINNTGIGYAVNNPGGGYGFTVSAGPSGGIQNIRNIQPSPSTPAPAPYPGTHVDVNFLARLDFTDTFTVTFVFQNNPLSLPSLSSPCPQSPPSTPHTLPYFEVTNGDISTGGGFYYVDPADGQTKCGGNNSVSPYISPATSPNNDYNWGGIRSFAAPINGKGSLADLGVYSLGYIRGSNSGPIGFISRDTFANAGLPASPDNLGGFLDSNSLSHCITDFYDTTQNSSTQQPFLSIGNNINNAVTGMQYTATGPITISGGSVPAGKQFTLYVDGDVTIDGDIKYATTWDPTQQDQIPFFAIIVKNGNIKLTHNVSQLDGMYVAQATDPDNTGRFETCDNEDNDFCPGVLTVNGAVIAQHLDLYRVHGTIANPSLSEDVNGICNNGPTNSPPAYCSAAEVFNYVPSMIMGMPAFNQLNGGAVVPSSLQGLFNLPPVF